jgi:hypothetical protein
MASHPLDGALADARLLACARQWEGFLQQAGRPDSFGVVHHGDLDGAIGGGYAGALLQKNFTRAALSHYWVGTDEYDFVDRTHRASCYPCAA